jgi:hypothetical protein
MTSLHIYEPRPPRFGLHQRSTLVRANGAESPATVVNVSQVGFCLKVADTPLVGEKVMLRGGAGEVPAQIRWAHGNDAGGIFLPPRDD